MLLHNYSNLKSLQNPFDQEGKMDFAKELNVPNPLPFLRKLSNRSLFRFLHVCTTNVPYVNIVIINAVSACVRMVVGELGQR